jgi:twitching motility two-component system response regulator PilH
LKVTSKVLLVDASPSTRKAVELALPASAFDLRVAPDGLAAIRLLPDFSPVLLALFLPGMDGVEVAAFLRSQPEYRTTALFLLRGPFETLDSSKLSSFDHDGLVQKPFDGDSLHRLVRTAIDRKRELPSLPEEPFLEPPVPPAVVEAPENGAAAGLAALPEWTDDVERKIREVIRQEIVRNQAEMEDRARDIVSAEFKKVLVEELKAIDAKR